MFRASRMAETRAAPRWRPGFGSGLGSRLSQKPGFARTVAQDGGVLRYLVVALALVGAVLALLWMLLLPTLAFSQLERATGFRVQQGRLLGNPFTGYFRLSAASIANPPGWPEPAFVQAKDMEARIRPWAFFMRPLQVSSLTLHIETLTIVVGDDERNNLSAWDAAWLQAFGSPEETLRSATAKLPRIETLDLSIDRIVVMNHAKAGEAPQWLEYRPAYHAQFHSVTRWQPIWDDLIARLAPR